MTESIIKAIDALEVYINNEWAYAKVRHAKESMAQEMKVVTDARAALQRAAEREKDSDTVQKATNQCHEAVTELHLLKEKAQGLVKVLEDIANDGFYPHAKSEFMKPDMYKLWARDALKSFQEEIAKDY